MKKKIILQLFLIILMIGSSVIFYRLYVVSNSKMVVADNNEDQNEANKSVEENQNIIENFQYSVENLNKEKYNISSKEAIIDLEQPDLIYMKDVVGVIQLNNLSSIYIYSDNALFSKTTYETNFDTNVLIKYDVHQIKSDKLKFIFKENLVTISNNVKYKSLNTELQADRVKIDLITKDTKIFMDNKTEKVKIVTSN